MKITKTLIEVLVFFAFLAISVSPSFGFFGDDKFEQEVEKEKGAIKLTREVLAGGYDVVSTEELKQMIDNEEDFLLIDTMPFEDSYKKNHIPGAEQFLFPIPEMVNWDNALTDNKSLDDFLSLLGDDPQRKIVFYCGFVKCTRSHNGALWAVKQGYTNVYRHPGGIFAWKGAGYEVEKVD
ncbi:MAG: rhodanese-like domain-containing protein [Desulfofustis sp.]